MNNKPQESAACNYEGHDFGATYIDSCCIDGYLWDLDSCDEPGGRLSDGGDMPCPKCNTLEYLEQAKEEAESCTSGSVFVSGGGYAYTGESIWLSAVRKAESLNPDGAAHALQKLGVVKTLVPEAGTNGYAVHRYIYCEEGDRT
ncbi:protein of unknown function [Acidithiobacillus ferrivorans]|nr:hypothetical protein [Acidithiobacillus ferrivorans]SMH64613.1 protein of unknown function [Acidithiobacillus ferrivorans]